MEQTDMPPKGKPVLSTNTCGVGFLPLEDSIGPTVARALLSGLCVRTTAEMGACCNNTPPENMCDSN